MKTRGIGILLVLFVFALATAVAANPDPDGAEVSVGTPETKANNTAGNVTADGGNITAVNLSGESKTLSWQGFFGEVTGNITLEDNSGDQLYSWNLTNVSGEVYASRSSAINFATVTGVEDCTIDEDLTGTGNDRTNFTFTNATVNFQIGTVSITSACQTYTYVSSAPDFTNFEQIIVNNTDVTSIYVARINNNTVGFDGATHDYQMIVPDYSNSTTTTYYFWVELSN